MLEGGGSYLSGNGGGVEFYNNIFSKNYSGNNGGGVFMGTYGSLMTTTGSATYMVNNTLINNQAKNYGGGAYIDNYIGSTIHNNIVWKNRAGTEGNNGNDLYINIIPVTFYRHYDMGLSIFNNILGRKADFEMGQSRDLVITAINSNYTQGNNITSNPRLNKNFLLRSKSPAIDAGDNAAVHTPSPKPSEFYFVPKYTDFKGDTRIIDGNGDGNAVVDIGANEAVPKKDH
jgi:hypothetical protein